MKKRFLALGLSLVLLTALLAVPASAAGLPFTDIPEDYYLYDEIQYVYENNLMEGTGNGLFSPDMLFTRAQFVTILGRMEGIDTKDYPGSSFSDVPATNWAAPYIQWASRNNIVNGTGGGKFSPAVIITEEQYATIVCRYMDATGRDFPGLSPWEPEIADAIDVAQWALPSVINMVRFGMVDLLYDWTYWPQYQLDRATIASYMTRLHVLLNHQVLPEVYDPAVYYDQDDEDIISNLQAAAAYEWNWFYANGYTSKTDTITAYNAIFGQDGKYERVVNPYVNSLKDLTELGYTHFVFDPVPQFNDVKKFIERNGMLYISEVDGLGGFFADRIHIDADKTSATTYTLDITVYADGGVFYQTTVPYIYDGQRWVFGELVPVDFVYVEDVEIAWG